MENINKKSYAFLFRLNLQDEIIRVNHAGELGAKYIYEGQIKALQEDREILEMLEGELIHLEYFEEKLRESKGRPSFFNGIWKFLAFNMGFLGARFGGRKVAMLCTAKVEEVIEKHYGAQIEALKDSELKETLKKFRNEEAHHMEAGKKSSEELKIIGFIFTFATKLGICVSKTL